MPLALIGLAVSAVGTGLSVYGQYEQGQAAQRAAEYNNNLAQQEARNTELEAAEQVNRQRQQERHAMGDLRVHLANNGTLDTEGTPLAILGESSANFELAIQDTVRKANLQAAAQRQQGAMGLWQGDQQQSASLIGALGTGLKGASGLYSQYDSDLSKGLLTPIPKAIPVAER